MTTHSIGVFRALAAAGLLLGTVACSDTGASLGNTRVSDLICSIPDSQIKSGGPGKDGIPALSNPEFVRPDEGGASYLRESDRVVGIKIRDQVFAIPLNIFWWHEIVNLTGLDTHLVVSHCPLTGSSLAFDRGPADDADFGVSGLLYQNNLIMYDRNRPESLWPQMLRGARCGDRNGTELPMVPIIEMTWGAWKGLYPDTWVVSAQTGYARDYRLYPYGSYASPNNPQVLYQMEVDTRRPPKERILGIPDGDGGIAFPFGVLDELGEVAAIHAGSQGEPTVVFWSRESQGAMAFYPDTDGQTLTFTVVEGLIVDEETGTSWGIDGVAEQGPLAGTQLDPVPEAFVAFWFAWPAFYPNVEIWGS